MRFLLVVLLWALTANGQHYSSADDPNLKLSIGAAGSILLGEMNCTSCHESNRADIIKKQAPILDEVGRRVKQDYMIAYLSDPQKVKPGTLMPDVLHRLTGPRKTEAALAITAYLTSDSPAPTTPPVDPKAILRGQELFHTVGCVACHSPRDEQGKELSQNSVPLGDLAGKYHLNALADFLFQPHKVRPSGAMPDMKLTKKEALDIAAYLGQNPPSSKVLTINSQLISQGKRLFDQFNCSSCHQLPSHKPAKSKSLSKLTTVDCQGPSYALSPTQQESIKVALTSSIKLDKPQQIHQTLVSYNCYACHQRDSIGGPEEKSKYFMTTENELGDTGRIPPPLTNIGAKLQRLWMHKVLFQGESLRPYMLTRMPQFGENNIGHLLDLFDAVDTVPESGLTPVEDKDEKKIYREAGWKLVGIEGNSCISCHNYNTYPSLGMKAFDLVSTAKRLKPDWFYHYMLNPTAHRPGVIMPSFWPAGKAIQRDILGGDTLEQLRAIWHYFTIGQTQRLPRGLSVPPVKLTAESQVRVYRGRSSIAGFRGIAIGFPTGLNMAFDAELMNFTTMWSGDFVKVNWRGQAPGNFFPAADSVSFNAGIPFSIKKKHEPWPVKQKISGKERLNTEPLFVQSRGYKFKGYHIDKNAVVFMYQYRGVKIDDKIMAVDNNTLVRTLNMNSPQSESFSFRIAASDDIKAVSDKKHLVKGLLEIETENKALLKGDDLILDLKIPSGTSQILLKYRSVR